MNKMNKIITYSDLECPSNKLKYLLSDLVCNFKCVENLKIDFNVTHTGNILTFTLNDYVYNITLNDLDNQTLSITGNSINISGGNSIDLTLIVNLLETDTFISNTNTGNKIADYHNENSSIFQINETITTIVNNGNNTFTYTNESGDTTLIGIVLQSCSFSSTLSSDGITLDFVINHCLSTILSSIIIESLSEDAQNYSWIDKSSSTLTVHYNVSLLVGTNNLTFNGIAFI